MMGVLADYVFQDVLHWPKMFSSVQHILIVLRKEQRSQSVFEQSRHQLLYIHTMVQHF